MNDYTSEDTIFVQIASYRDPELQWTLKDLFEKAKRPENIFVGICHQYDMKGDEDKHLFEIPFSHPEQLRIDNVDYRESQGCCWARNRVQKLWKGEKWTLQLDSHIRFEKDWDETLVQDMKDLNDEKAIISQVLPGYKINNNFEVETNLNMGFCTCDIKNSLRTYSTTVRKRRNYYLACIMYAAFRFGLSKYFQKHIINPKLGSNDEVMSSLELWYNGCNLYNYSKVLIYHLWLDAKTDRSKDKSRCNTFINKNQSFINNFLNYYLKFKYTNDPEVLENIKEYGLGNKRTLRDYERFSGVDFRRKITREHTKQGIFEDWNEVSKINDIKNIFNNIRYKYAK